VVALLRRQNVRVERLSAPWTGRAERFPVDSVAAQPRPFEGHRLVSVEGQWRAAEPDSVPAGWYVVKTGQPLGVLASYLLEPASEDGVVAWNFMDRDLQRGSVYPFRRTHDPVTTPAEIVE
jgi:hypothetical protein